MKTGLLLLLALGLFINGCATTDNPSSTESAEAEVNLELGMTKAQIIEIYGETDRISQTARGETWTYHHNLGEQFIPFNFGYRPKITILTFDNEGKLVDFSRTK